MPAMETPPQGLLEGAVASQWGYIEPRSTNNHNNRRWQVKRRRNGGSYDPAKDALVKTYPPIPGDGTTTILVEAYRYDGGALKVQFTRLRNNRRGKLGRITPDEAIGIVTALQQFELDVRCGKVDGVATTYQAATESLKQARDNGGVKVIAATCATCGNTGNVEKGGMQCVCLDCARGWEEPIPGTAVVLSDRDPGRPKRYANVGKNRRRAK